MNIFLTFLNFFVDLTLRKDMDEMERKRTHYCVYCTCEANTGTKRKPMSLLHIQMWIEAILVCKNI